MEFSVLFWNIWQDNQMYGQKRLKVFLRELKRVLEEYDPDFIGLSEVIKDSKDSSDAVTDFLHDLGYKYSYYEPIGQQTDKWLIGNSISSKLPLKSIKNLELGNSITSERRGYPGYKNKAIAATISLGNKSTIKLISVHPTYINSHTFLEHYKQIKFLASFVRQEEYASNTIVGGDFNEPIALPWSIRKNFHRRTGTFFNPTWQHKASRKSLLRSNLDKLLWSKRGSLKLKGFKLIDNNISDHRPIYAKFYI